MEKSASIDLEKAKYKGRNLGGRKLGHQNPHNQKGSITLWVGDSFPGDPKVRMGVYLLKRKSERIRRFKDRRFAFRNGDFQPDR